MIEVSDVKKLGPKWWRRDIDDVPFHHLAVILQWNKNRAITLVSGGNYVDCGRSYLD